MPGPEKALGRDEPSPCGEEAPKNVQMSEETGSVLSTLLFFVLSLVRVLVLRL